MDFKEPGEVFFDRGGVCPELPRAPPAILYRASSGHAEVPEGGELLEIPSIFLAKNRLSVQPLPIHRGDTAGAQRKTARS